MKTQFENAFALTVEAKSAVIDAAKAAMVLITDLVGGLPLCSKPQKLSQK
jgi:hypothetical protein